jgi:hypothetical protein
MFLDCTRVCILLLVPPQALRSFLSPPSLGFNDRNRIISNVVIILGHDGDSAIGKYIYPETDRSI